MPKKPKDRDFIKLRVDGDTLDLGRLVAEEDPDLDKYYVAPERFVDKARNINDPAAFFIGPKGAGKSAILQMVALRNSTDANCVIRISPGDLAFSALAHVEATSPILGDAGNNQWIFKSLWDYVLALEVFRREYADQGALSRVFSSLTGGQHRKEVKKLLEISEGNGPHSLTERILQLIKEIELSGEVGGAKVSGRVSLEHGASGRQGEGFELLSLVNSVARQIPKKLKRLYYVLIDDLDLYWKDAPIPNSFIAALFSSLKHISRPPHIKCIVALRQNIYERLPIIDRDKFHDWVCRVSWDLESVRRMVEERVVFKFALTRKEIWGGLFPEQAFAVMWSHCNGKPRELIRLAYLSIDTAKTQGHNRVLQEDMDASIKLFSEDRLRDVASECQDTFPALDLLVRKMAGWPKEFPYSKLTEFVVLRGMEVKLEEPLSQRYAWAGGYIDDPNGMIHVLLNCGILLIKASRTDTAKPFDPENPLELTKDRWFAIHPMFAPGLGLVGAH